MNIMVGNFNSVELTGLDNFIAQEIQTFAEKHHQHKLELASYAKNFLDKVFPLENGSHKEVKSYVIYYQHLLAFFDDGTHSGLATPSQFIGLCGYRENPDALLLKDKECFVEISIDRNGCVGKYNAAHIDDILIETNQFGFDAGNRSWFSMVKHYKQLKFGRDDKVELCCSTNKKEFTSKSGELITL